MAGKNVITRQWGRIRSVAQSGFFKVFLCGILAQSIISLTNLLLKVWVARELPKADYGLYTIGFETMYVFLGIQNALVNSPMQVMINEKWGQRRQDFVNGLFLGQLVVLVGLTGIALAANQLSGILFEQKLSVAFLCVILLGVSTMWLREFNRVLSYTKLKIGRVFSIDAVFVVSAVLFLLYFQLSRSFSYNNALLILGLSYGLSAGFGFLVNGEKHALRVHDIKQSFSETWAYSRWAIVGVIASNVQMRAYVYITSIAIGLESTAEVAVARVLLMPFVLLISSSQRIFLSQGSSIMHRQDLSKFKKFILFFLLFFTAGWLMYSTVLFAFSGKIVQLLFTARYLGIRRFIAMWAVSYLIISWRFCVTYSLQVLKEFKALALYGVVSACVVLMSSLLMIKLMGPVGVIVAMAVGEIVLLSLSLPKLLSALKRRGKELGNYGGSSG